MIIGPNADQLQAVIVQSLFDLLQRVATLLLMLVGMFAGAAQNLLLSLSLYTFLGAATVLLYLSFKRKQAEAEKSDEEQ